MKQILRNFIVTLTRFRMASLLNIFGLSIALSVFIILITQLHWEFTYNQSIPNHQNIYRGIVKWDNKPTINMSRPIGEITGNASPQIEKYSVAREDGISYFKRLDQGFDATEIRSNIYEVSRSFLEMFSIEFTDGSIENFATTSSAIVPVSFAEKLWKTCSQAIGQPLTSNYGDTLTVVGVYKDLPTNISVPNSVMINIADERIEDQSEWSYMYYYQIPNGQNTKEVETQAFQKLAERFNIKEEKVQQDFFSLEPFDDIYFSHVQSFLPRGNKTLSLVLLTVAILVLLVAVINYINFFMALAPIRIRSVNINKVFGTPTGALRANFIGEAVGIMALSFFLALAWVEVASTTYIAEFSEASLKFGDNLFVVGMTALLALFIGAFAGLFPAIYITRFSPAMVLRGSFGRSRQGQRMRMMLTAFQFVVSITLIIGAWFITLQNNFMQGADYGFDRDRLATASVSAPIARKPEAFLAELKKNPNILDVAYADGSLVNVGMGWGRSFKGESVNFKCLPVSWNYPEFMGIELVEGRYFTEDDRSKVGGTIIFNETAAKAFKVKVGDFIQGHSNEAEAEVVGIAKDFNFNSLSEEIKPLALYEFGSTGWRIPQHAYFRLAPNADFKATSEYIASVMATLNPDIKKENVNIKPFDQTIENLYLKEQKISDIISLFSIVAIVIALVGVFGLIVFETQYRRKEIALRKVHGSSVAQILAILNRRFVWIVVVSFAISAPLAWLAVSTWLDGFAYQVPLHWWVFAAALLIVLAVTTLTVTLQTMRAANENPIKALKGE